jgi:hypothetical protein
VRPYLEKMLHKKGAGGVAEGVGPEFKPSTAKKEEKKKGLGLIAWKGGLSGRRSKVAVRILTLEISGALPELAFGRKN